MRLMRSSSVGRTRDRRSQLYGVSQRTAPHMVSTSNNDGPPRVRAPPESDTAALGRPVEDLDLSTLRWPCSIAGAPLSHKLRSKRKWATKKALARLATWLKKSPVLAGATSCQAPAQRSSGGQAGITVRLFEPCPTVTGPPRRTVQGDGGIGTLHSQQSPWGCFTPVVGMATQPSWANSPQLMGSPGQLSPGLASSMAAGQGLVAWASSQQLLQMLKPAKTGTAPLLATTTNQVPPIGASAAGLLNTQPVPAFPLMPALGQVPFGLHGVQKGPYYGQALQYQVGVTVPGTQVPGIQAPGIQVATTQLPAAEGNVSTAQTPPAKPHARQSPLTAPDKDPVPSIITASRQSRRGRPPRRGNCSANGKQQEGGATKAQLGGGSTAVRAGSSANTARGTAPGSQRQVAPPVVAIEPQQCEGEGEASPSQPRKNPRKPRARGDVCVREAAAAGLNPLEAAQFQRLPGGTTLFTTAVSRLLEMVQSNSREFDADGRVLKLKKYIKSDVSPMVIDAVLEMLKINTRVEVLYIQNFEDGMLDAQLDHLGRVLRLGRIWAVNVGENFHLTRPAVCRFADALPHTAVAYLYVSECHLLKCNLKAQMRAAIRANRNASPPRAPEVLARVTHMWYNPKPPTWWLLQQAGHVEQSGIARAALVLALAEPRSPGRDAYLELIRTYCRTWMHDPHRGEFEIPPRPAPPEKGFWDPVEAAGKQQVVRVGLESKRGQDLAFAAWLVAQSSRRLPSSVASWRARVRRRMPVAYSHALAHGCGRRRKREGSWGWLSTIQRPPVTKVQSQAAKLRAGRLGMVSVQQGAQLVLGSAWDALADVDVQSGEERLVAVGVTLVGKDGASSEDVAAAEGARGSDGAEAPAGQGSGSGAHAMRTHLEGSASTANGQEAIGAQLGVSGQHVNACIGMRAPSWSGGPSVASASCGTHIATAREGPTIPKGITSASVELKLKVVELWKDQRLPSAALASDAPPPVYLPRGVGLSSLELCEVAVIQWHPSEADAPQFVDVTPQLGGPQGPH